MELLNINEIPFVESPPIDGRQVVLLTEYSEGKWNVYVQPHQQQFLRLKSILFVKGSYYAKQKASAIDLELLFGTMIMQHLSFPNVIQSYRKVESSLNMLSAILQKQLIFRNVENAYESLPFVIETEIEHAILLCRSIYDEINHVISDITSLLITVNGKRITGKLPRSFARIALDGETVRSASEINSKWGIPILIAQLYNNHALHFRKIREIRVSIEHHGIRVPGVFHTEKGFAISTTHIEAWNTLDVWGQHELLPNELGSVRALLAYLTKNILKILDDFVHSVELTIPQELWPAPIFGSRRVFMTSPIIGVLSDLDTQISNPWVNRNANSLHQTQKAGSVNTKN